MPFPTIATNKWQNNMNRNICNVPYFSQQSQKIAEFMAQKTAEDLQKLMNISPKLAQLNYLRYQEIIANTAYKLPAILSFAGDAYQALNPNDFNNAEHQYLQNHLAILSGLYGLLRPFDLIAPYRLEMNTAVKIANTNNLYDFWRDRINLYLEELLATHKQPILLNLASDEYSRAICSPNSKINVIQIAFRQQRDNQLKNIGILAKRARGTMLRHIVKNHIDELAMIKEIRFDGYYFAPERSNKNLYYFVQTQIS